MAELGEGLSGYLDVQDATLRAPRIEAVSNIGISNTAPQHAFSVGSNLYVSTDSSNVLTVDGNVVCEGVKVGLIEIIPSYDFAAVSNVGNVTQSTIQFSNATTAFVTTANIEVGTANLFVDTTTGNVGIGKTDPGSALDVVGDVNATGSLTVSKDIESSNSFITERVLFKETWPNGHNSLAGDLGTWVVTNLNLQSNPSSTTTPDGYTHVSFNGVPASNGEFVSPAFDLSDYAIVDGTLQADDKRKTTTRVFLKCWFGTKQLDASGEVAQVQFSPDNGSTWYTVATSQDRTSDDRFTMVSADLSPYILETSTNAKIRFYMPWSVANGDYIRIGRIWIHESDVPTNLGGMWLGAGGNIGIGTTNPRVDLEIENVNGSPELRFTDPFSGSTAGWDARSNVLGEISWYSRDNQFTDSYAKVASITSKHFDDGWPDGALCFTTSTNGVLNEDAMVIDQTGNVGIGTTNPQSILDVRGGDGTASDTYATFGKAVYASAGWSGIRLGTPYASAHDAYCSVIESYNDHSVDYNSQLRFKTSSGDNAEASERMRITSNGNVGIGTTNPNGFEVYNKSINQKYRDDFTNIHVNNKYQIDSRDGAAPNTLSQRYGVRAADNAGLNPEIGELIIGAHADQNDSASDGVFLSFNDSSLFYIATHPTANYGEDVTLGSNQSYPYIGTNPDNRISPRFTVSSSGAVSIPDGILNITDSATRSRVMRLGVTSGGTGIGFHMGTGGAGVWATTNIPMTVNNSGGGTILFVFNINRSGSDATNSQVFVIRKRYDGGSNWTSTSTTVKNLAYLAGTGGDGTLYFRQSGNYLQYKFDQAGNAHFYALEFD